MLLVLAFSLSGATSDQLRQFDEFGDLNCEDEYARLDNLALQLQNEPNAKAVIVFYGGRRFRGHLPKRSEAAARAARLKPYLVQRRGIPAERVEVIDGGYKEAFQIQLWVIPIEVRMPLPDPSIQAKGIKFQKGKATARQFKCQI
jgi:hypothetical protein